MNNRPARIDGSVVEQPLHWPGAERLLAGIDLGGLFGRMNVKRQAGICSKAADGCQ